jgi:colicin import membrane protein
MARKLNTYTTSAGFFDLAVAAPSMKAALEAWGAKTNLFHQGFAKRTDDPDIIAATIAKPGVVLRRPVGTDDAFSEHPDLPRHLPSRVKVRRRPVHRQTVAHASQPQADEKAAREAARAFEREQKRSEAARQREEAALKKQRERRERAIAVAEAALENATRKHQTIVQAIERERDMLDRKSEAEDARWKTKKEDLEEALRKARALD